MGQCCRGAGLVVDVARIDGGDAVAAGGEGAGAEAGLGGGQRDRGAEVGAVIGELDAAAGCAAAYAGGEGDALAGIARVAIAGDAGAAGGQGVGPVADQHVAVDGTEAAGLVVGRAAGAGGKAADAGHRIVARGDAVKIGGTATVLQRGEGVEGGVGVALAVAGLLVDQGDDAGEGGRCGGGAGEDVERLRPGAVVARIDEVAVVRGGIQRNVGNVALAVGGDAGRVLPGRLGIVEAGATTAGPQRRSAIGGALVPDRFRDVGKRRTGIGVVGRRPVQRRVGGIGKLGAADAGAVDRRTEPVDAPAVRCRRRAGAVAAGGAAVAGRDDDGHPLGDSLLPEVAVEVGAGAAEVRLALPVAEADDVGDVVADRVLGGKGDAVGRGGALRGDELDRGGGRHGAGPFQVEIGFAFVAADVARIGTVDDDLRRTGRQVHAAAKFLDIGDRDVGTAKDGDALAVALDRLGVNRLEIVDGVEIARRQVMRAAVAVVGRWLLAQVQRPAVKIVQRNDAVNDVGQRPRDLRLAGIGEMELVSVTIAPDFGMKRPPDLGDGAAEKDGAATGRDFVDIETLLPQPLAHLGNIARRDAEVLLEALRRQPAPVLRRCRVANFSQEGVEGGVLAGIRLKGQDDAVETEAIGGSADVVGVDGLRMPVAGQGDTGAFVDRRGDARLGSHACQTFHFRRADDRRVPGQHQDGKRKQPETIQQQASNA